MTSFSNQILQRVSDFISDNHLLSISSDVLQQGPLFVGLSGGSDSVALLHILHSLGYKCMALHCNFHLRDAESDRDQAFCQELCTTLDIPLDVMSFDTRLVMHDEHLSLEMAARRLRYNWWMQKINTCTESDKARIAIGHHQDDSIETMLMNLMRGTGINGMTGIVAYNAQTHVIRPLLCLSRQEIIDYLKDNDLGYVTDSTNAENDTLRNQIRNRLLPLMQEIVPQCRQGMVQSMSHLAETQYFANEMLSEYDWLTKQYNEWGLEWSELDISKLNFYFYKHQETYLYEWQRTFCNPTTQQVLHDAQHYYTAPIDEEEYEDHKPALTVIEYEGEKPKDIEERYHEDFDAEKVSLPLKLRRWQEGDRIAPLGMNGHTKLISDLFQNAHYSPMQKATTWIIEDAKGEIIWAIGLRMSELHKITKETKRVLRLSCK